MRRTLFAAALFFTCAASASAQTGSPMRYAAATGTLKYSGADTTSRTMGGAGGLTTTMTLATSIDISMRAENDSLRVTTRLTDMKGSMSAMEQSMDVPKSPGWDAPAEFMLAPNGSARLLPGAAAGPGGLEAYTRMFPRLPQGAITRGQSWNDSTSENMSEEGITGSMSSKTVGTWVSDSTVGGHSVRVLRYVSQHEVKVKGTQGGSDISQELAGTVTTLALWDNERRVMIEVHETGELRGAVNAPSMGMVNAELSQKVGRHTRLLP